MDWKRTKVIENFEYPFGGPEYITHPTRNYTTLFKTQRLHHRENERTRKERMEETIKSIKQTQKLKIKPKQSEMNLTCQICSEQTQSNSQMIVCECCETQMCSKCLKKRKYKFKDGNELEIPLCLWCEKMFDLVASNLRLKTAIVKEKEHKNMKTHAFIIDKCRTFAREMIYLDLLIAAIFSKEKRSVTELADCTKQLRKTENCQKEILQMDNFIKSLTEFQQRSDETIKKNIIRAFRFFNNSIVMKAFSDFDKYQEMINKQLYYELVPEIIHVDSIIVSECGGITKLLMDRIKPMDIIVDGKKTTYEVDGNYIYISIPPKPKEKVTETIDLKMYFNKKEITVSFPLLYVAKQMCEVVNDNESEGSENSGSSGKRIKVFEIDSVDDDEDFLSIGSSTASETISQIDSSSQSYEVSIPEENGNELYDSINPPSMYQKNNQQIQFLSHNSECSSASSDTIVQSNQFDSIDISESETNDQIVSNSSTVQLYTFGNGNALPIIEDYCPGIIDIEKMEKNIKQMSSKCPTVRAVRALIQEIQPEQITIGQNKKVCITGQGFGKCPKAYIGGKEIVMYEKREDNIIVGLTPIFTQAGVFDLTVENDKGKKTTLVGKMVVV